MADFSTIIKSLAEEVDSKNLVLNEHSVVSSDKDVFRHFLSVLDGHFAYIPGGVESLNLCPNSDTPLSQISQVEEWCAPSPVFIAQLLQKLGVPQSLYEKVPTSAKKELVIWMQDVIDSKSVPKNPPAVFYLDNLMWFMQSAKFSKKGILSFFDSISNYLIAAGYDFLDAEFTVDALTFKVMQEGPTTFNFLLVKFNWQSASLTLTPLVFFKEDNFGYQAPKYATATISLNRYTSDAINFALIQAECFTKSLINSYDMLNIMDSIDIDSKDMIFTDDKGNVNLPEDLIFWLRKMAHRKIYQAAVGTVGNSFKEGTGSTLKDFYRCLLDNVEELCAPGFTLGDKTWYFLPGSFLLSFYNRYHSYMEHHSKPLTGSEEAYDLLFTDVD